MKIATFIINGINKRLPNLLTWLASAKPDVVCLQELKTAHETFPIDAIRAAGYNAVWRGERSWNGVAILARNADPVLIRDTLPGDLDEHQSRYIEAAVNGALVASLYLPNGNPQPGPKFTYKLDWFDRLIDHTAGLLHDDVPVVLAGDFNVVPTNSSLGRTSRYCQVPSDASLRSLLKRYLMPLAITIAAVHKNTRQRKCSGDGGNDEHRHLSHLVSAAGILTFSHLIHCRP